MEPILLEITEGSCRPVLCPGHMAESVFLKPRMWPLGTPLPFQKPGSVMFVLEHRPGSKVSTDLSRTRAPRADRSLHRPRRRPPGRPRWAMQAAGRRATFAPFGPFGVERVDVFPCSFGPGREQYTLCRKIRPPATFDLIWESSGISSFLLRS